MPASGSDIPPDWIRAAVKARMAERGLSAYAVAKLTDGRVSDDAVQRYLAGTRSLTSGLLQHVLDALGLVIEAGDRTAPPAGS